LLHKVILLIENIVTDTLKIGILQISIEIDLDDTIADSLLELLLGRTRSTVEDQEDWLVLLSSNSFLNILLMLAKQFWLKLNISGLVDTVDVSESSGNRKVWGDWGEGLVDGKDILRLGI
jgi:hypothetical protein